MVNNIYLENGYIDMRAIMCSNSPYIILTGARGTGKTYGALMYSYLLNKKIIYMRRTGPQIDTVCAMPDILYKSVNTNLNINVIVETRKTINIIKDMTDPEDPKIIGYCAALTTFSGLRSLDMSDIDMLIYDEFCSDTDRTIKNEDLIFLNILETIGRNREIQGKKPLKVILMANSINLENPIFRVLKLTGPAIRLMQQGRLVWTDPERGIELYNIFNSPISKKKAGTTLYKLTDNADFRDMALYNRYTANDLSHVKPQNLKNYEYVLNFGELHLYKSRNSNVIYVSAHGAGTPRHVYGSNSNEIQRARRELINLPFNYFDNTVIFESYELEIIFKSYFNIR